MSVAIHILSHLKRRVLLISMICLSYSFTQQRLVCLPCVRFSTLSTERGRKQMWRRTSTGYTYLSYYEMKYHLTKAGHGIFLYFLSHSIYLSYTWLYHHFLPCNCPDHTLSCNHLPLGLSRFSLRVPAVGLAGLGWGVSGGQKRERKRTDCKYVCYLM